MLSSYFCRRTGWEAAIRLALSKRPPATPAQGDFKVLRVVLLRHTIVHISQRWHRSFGADSKERVRPLTSQTPVSDRAGLRVPWHSLARDPLPPMPGMSLRLENTMI
jgi:hypothetical protein